MFNKNTKEGFGRILFSSLSSFGGTIDKNLPNALFGNVEFAAGLEVLRAWVCLVRETQGDSALQLFKSVSVAVCRLRNGEEDRARNGDETRMSSNYGYREEFEVRRPGGNDEEVVGLLFQRRRIVMSRA